MQGGCVNACCQLGILGLALNSVAQPHQIFLFSPPILRVCWGCSCYTPGPAKPGACLSYVLTWLWLSPVGSVAVAILADAVAVVVARLLLRPQVQLVGAVLLPQRSPLARLDFWMLLPALKRQKHYRMTCMDKPTDTGQYMSMAKSAAELKRRPTSYSTGVLDLDVMPEVPDRLGRIGGR